MNCIQKICKNTTVVRGKIHEPIKKTQVKDRLIKGVNKASLLIIVQLELVLNVVGTGAAQIPTSYWERFNLLYAIL